MMVQRTWLFVKLVTCPLDCGYSILKIDSVIERYPDASLDVDVETDCCQKELAIN